LTPTHLAWQGGARDRPRYRWDRSELASGVSAGRAGGPLADAQTGSWQGANAVVGVSLTTSTYEASGSQWQVTRPVYIRTPVRIWCSTHFWSSRLGPEKPRSMNPCGSLRASQENGCCTSRGRSAWP